MDKFRHDELFWRVDEVLFYKWDPIGVAPEPCARHEYLSYVPKVLHLVERGDESAIAEHLAGIAKGQMGLTPDQENCIYVAKVLLQHKRAIEDCRA